MIISENMSIMMFQERVSRDRKSKGFITNRINHVYKRTKIITKIITWYDSKYLGKDKERGKKIIRSIHPYDRFRLPLTYDSRHSNVVQRDRCKSSVYNRATEDSNFASPVTEWRNSVSRPRGVKRMLGGPWTEIRG